MPRLLPLVILLPSLAASAQTIKPVPSSESGTVLITTAGGVAVGDPIALFAAATSTACSPAAASVPITGSNHVTPGSTTLTLAGKLVSGTALCGIVVHGAKYLPIKAVLVAAPPPVAASISPVPNAAGKTITVFPGTVAGPGNAIALFTGVTADGCNAVVGKAVPLKDAPNKLAAGASTQFMLQSSLVAGNYVCGLIISGSNTIMIPPVAVAAAPLVPPSLSPVPAGGVPTITLTTGTASPADLVVFFSTAGGGACNAASTLAPLVGTNVIGAGASTDFTLKTPLSSGSTLCGLVIHQNLPLVVAQVTVGPTPAPPPATPKISPAPTASDTSVKIVRGDTATSGDFVSLFAGATAAACGKPPVNQLSAAGSAINDDPTAITLSGKPTAGNFLCGIVVHGASVLTIQPVLISAGAGAAPAAAGPAVAGTTPAFKPTPTEGDTKLTLVTAPALEGDQIAIYSASSRDACSAKSTAVALAPNTSSAVLAGQQTVIITKDPVTQGQNLCAVITSKTGATIPDSMVATVDPPATPPGYDWGLVRAYFTLGALASQERGQFSHQDLFMAFHLDKAYLPFKLQFPSPTANLTDEQKAVDIYTHRPGLSAFFETRLTAVPVAVQNCTSTATSTCSTTTTTTGSGSTPPSTDSQAFLNSQKSARLEFGVLVPILLHPYAVESKKGSQTIYTPYSLFVAPLIKTGFDTTLNGLNQTQQGTGTPTTVQAIGNSNTFYKFWNAGFRLGHYQLTSKASQSPDLLSYIDVSFGRFSNLSSLLCPSASYMGNNTCKSAAGSLPWTRDIRLNVEGLLQVPASHGFSVGFSTNVAFDPFGRQGNKSFLHIRPQDDLRFLFAYKFDITKIAAKLAPQFATGN